MGPSPEISQIQHQLQLLAGSEPAFIRRQLRRARLELLGLLESSGLPAERRSYFLHQISQCQELAELQEVSRLLNQALSKN